MTSFLKSLTAKHWITFFSSLLECLCFAGVVFGWASLAFVLKEDAYFGYLCVNATGVNTTGVNETQILDCSKQDEQFSLVFTISSFMVNFLTLLNGFFFDRFGTTVARFVGIGLFTAGSLLMAFSTAALSNFLFPALPLLAVGGNLFRITNFQVANLFGPRRATIITLLNGAVGASSVVFLVIKVLHENGIPLLYPFLFIAACSVLHIVRTLFLLPKTRIPYPPPANYTYGITCGKSRTLSVEQITADDSVETATEEVEVVPEKQVPSEMTFRECLKSRFFLLHIVWLSVQQLRNYLFIGTVNPRLHRLTGGDYDLVSEYTNAFAITQLCGVFFAPMNGLIMDRNKSKPRAEGESEHESDLRASVLSLFLTPLQCLLFSICASLPYLKLQYFTSILQVLNRAFISGGNAAFISIAFPSSHFGKLYGLAQALSAVFSLLQYACFAIVNGPLDGEPLYMNIALTVLSLFAFCHPLSVFLHCRKLISQRGIGAPPSPEPDQNA